MRGGDPLPLNKQIRGPSNKLSPKPTKPYTLTERAPKTNAPATNKGKK